MVAATSSDRVAKRSSIAANDQTASQPRMPIGTMATSDQKIEDKTPITMDEDVRVTRYATIGPIVNGKAIGIQRESKRDNANETAQSTISTSNVEVENCL